MSSYPGEGLSAKESKAFAADDGTITLEIVDMSVDEARDLFKWTHTIADLDDALDAAQGPVFSDEKDVAYVLIRIRK